MPSSLRYPCCDPCYDFFKHTLRARTTDPDGRIPRRTINVFLSVFVVRRRLSLEQSALPALAVVYFRTATSLVAQEFGLRSGQQHRNDRTEVTAVASRVTVLMSTSSREGAEWVLR